MHISLPASDLLVPQSLNPHCPRGTIQRIPRPSTLLQLDVGSTVDGDDSGDEDVVVVVVDVVDGSGPILHITHLAWHLYTNQQSEKLIFWKAIL